MAPLTRRRRLLGLTAGAAALFVGIAVWLIRLALEPPPAYTPGGDLAELTAELARDLPEDYPRVTFEDVTERAGIRFRNFPATRTAQLPEDMGSGAAWGDFDEDGWPDLAIAGVAGPFDPTTPPEGALALYRNRGDGTFEDVTDRAGLAVSGWGMAVEWADVNGDGRLDLLHSGYGRLSLFGNRGDGTFEDLSASSGVADHVGFWAGVGFADYDRDGDLDLYVAGYVEYNTTILGATSRHYDVEEPASINPSSFAPIANLLLDNDGRGHFTDVARRAGVADPDGRSLEVAWTDFDNDGWPDLYVANDVSDNRLYRNLGTGTFEDVSHAARVADYRGAMGLAIGDWDADLDLDILVTHWIAQENALYSNRLSDIASGAARGAPLHFMDEADRHGLGQIALDFIGWGTSFFDYDNDGRLDLLVVNGSTFQQRQDSTKLVPMRDLLFWNDGPAAGFYSVGPVSGDYFSREHVGRGAAVADYDRDGDLDIYIVSHGEVGTLLENQADRHHGWVQIGLRGTTSNTFGIGARLEVVAGGRTQIRDVGAQSSYLSQNELVEHFGLGPDGTVDTVTITWPSGAKDVHTGVTARQRIVFTEGRP